MTAFLPPNLLALFEARPPIPFVPPPQPLLSEKNEKLPECRYNGIAEYVNLFEDPVDTPPKPVVETRDEKKARKRREKEELLAYKVEQGIAQWNPADNPKATEDPYKTLFVARINYETSENKLKREFETYGKIKKLSMIHDQSGKPRGYAFIEYTSKDDMHSAYKRADGAKVDGRRLIVDYERGRTQKTWLPRRLGGGKGDTRRARESKRALEEKEGNFGGGEREGFSRGGFAGGRDRDRSRRSRSREGGDREKKDRERGGYRGGPPAVASYASGAGNVNGYQGGGGGGYNRDRHGGRDGGYGGGRDGGYGGGGRGSYGGGRDRDSYGGGGRDSYAGRDNNGGGGGRDRRY